jgi:hypothetical protein
MPCRPRPGHLCRNLCYANMSSATGDDQQWVRHALPSCMIAQWVPCFPFPWRATLRSARRTHADLVIENPALRQRLARYTRDTWDTRDTGRSKIVTNRENLRRFRRLTNSKSG